MQAITTRNKVRGDEEFVSLYLVSVHDNVCN